MKSASEIIEKWLCDGYAAYRDALRAESAGNKRKGPKNVEDAEYRAREAALNVLLPVTPQAALAVHTGFTTVAQETVKTLNEVAQFIEEQGLSGAANHIEALRANAADLQAEHDRLVCFDPFKPWHTDPGGGNPAWNPTGYAGIAYARNHLLADCLRWMAIRPTTDPAAEQLRTSLARLTVAAERVDAPMRTSTGKRCGVSVMAAALLVNDDERDAATVTKKRWQSDPRYKELAKKSIGVSPRHSQTKLYEPSEILAFIKKVETPVMAQQIADELRQIAQPVRE